MSDIDNLMDLSNTVTAVVNRALEVVTEKSESGQYYISHDDVADLISKEDYLRFFDFIAFDLAGRPEVLDLETEDHELSVVCGLKWCKSYQPLPEEEGMEFGDEPLCREPSMARMAEIGEKVMEHIVLNNEQSKIKPEDFGITPEELDYVRVFTGFDKPIDPIAPTPVTKESYEALLIQNSHYLDHITNEGINSNTKSEHNPFCICVNMYGQSIADNLLSQYPRSQELFRQIFREPTTASSICWGAMIGGRPAIIYSHYLDRCDITEPNLSQAALAMKAAQLDAMFTGSNAKITYNFMTEGPDELMAILPADGDHGLLRQFEGIFENAVAEMPFTQDTAWVKKQYEAILEKVAEKIQQSKTISPWTASAPEQVALKACEALGTYLGQYQHEWSQANRTQDQEKLTRLSKKMDAASNPELLSKIVESGLYTAENELSKRITFYTKPAKDDEKAESFTVPLGQLSMAMEKMGYKDDYPVYSFLTLYSYEMAQELKSVVEHLPKRSLTQQINGAQQRQSTEQRPKEIPSKDMDRGH